MKEKEAWVGQNNHKKVSEVLLPLLYKKRKTGYLTSEEAAYNQGIMDAINPIVLMLEGSYVEKRN